MRPTLVPGIFVCAPDCRADPKTFFSRSAGSLRFLCERFDELPDPTDPAYEKKLDSTKDRLVDFAKTLLHELASERDIDRDWLNELLDKI